MYFYLFFFLNINLLKTKFRKKINYTYINNIKAACHKQPKNQSKNKQKLMKMMLK